ncbi:MAG: hypothetical protein ACOYKR_06760 [Sphingobacterium thalpophilum]
MNLVEIDKEEALSINGGMTWSAALRNTWYGALLLYFVDNYEDIKSGATSAYKDYHKK